MKAIRSFLVATLRIRDAAESLVRRDHDALELARVLQPATRYRLPKKLGGKLVGRTRVWTRRDLKRLAFPRGDPMAPDVLPQTRTARALPPMSRFIEGVFRKAVQAARENKLSDLIDPLDQLRAAAKKLLDAAHEAAEDDVQDVPLECVQSLNELVLSIERRLPSDATATNGPPEGFVLLTEVMHVVAGMTHSRARKFIAKHHIRTWKPSPKARRCFVCLADWHAAQHDENKSPTDEQIAKFVAGMELRKKTLRAAKKADRTKPCEAGETDETVAVLLPFYFFSKHVFRRLI